MKPVIDRLLQAKIYPKFTSNGMYGSNIWNAAEKYNEHNKELTIIFQNFAQLEKFSF